MEESTVESESSMIEVPGFIVNLIGRLTAENEALKAGLTPATSVVEDVVE